MSISKKEIGLYWWRGSHINIGDEINHDIVEYVSGRKVRKTEIQNADLLAIGSVIQFPQRSKSIFSRKQPYNVWGSGTLSAENLVHQEKFYLSSVRGPLTKSLFPGNGVSSFGDPGILSSAVWEPSNQKKYNWGLIPHFSQMDRPWVQRLIQSDKVALIDVRDPDIPGTMSKISSCNSIASTSLHGLVIADSYQIPSAWLWDGAPHSGGAWKFFDYFAGINRHLSDPVQCAKLNSLDDIDIESKSFSHFQLIEVMKKNVYNSFPF